MRSDANRVNDIAGAIDAIERYALRGRDEFFRDELTQTWMLHHLALIGEALRSMTEEFQTRFNAHLDGAVGSVSEPSSLITISELILSSSGARSNEMSQG